VSTQASVELQLLPIAGGSARTIRSWEEYAINSARLSPDGKTVIFETDRVGNGEVFTVPVSGGEPTPFAPNPRTDQSPRYSPDGSQVAIASDRGGSFDIWLVPAGGGEARNLTSAPGDESNPEWSPDGTKIAFTSNRDVGGFDLWVIPAAGGSATRLTTSNMRPQFTQWSPDSKYLYFVGEKPGAVGGRDYFRVASTGGRPEPLGARPDIGFSRLSRDGTRVAYASFERGWALIYVMPATGGSSTRVTRDTTNVYHGGGVWTQGDSLLVVGALDLASNRDAADLWIYRLSDGSWNPLTRTLGFENPQDFTPDGKEVLVVLGTERRQIKRVAVSEFVARR
jgi:Tol biopolymer transport system component